MFAKKIVAGAALLAVAAVAHADVKLYGALDVGFGSYKGAGQKSTTQVSSGNMMTSFIGFSGSEDLGGGLKAEFALESFIAPDTGSTLTNNTGSSGFWGRGSNVALSGGFGKVAIGQYDNPLFTYGLSYNPFGSSMFFSPTMRHYYGLGLGNNVRTSGYGPAASAALHIDTGGVNSLTYEAPVIGGFAAVVQWSPKESSTAGSKDSFTLGGSYNAGPLSLAVAYASVGSAGPNATYGPQQKVTALGGSYDFGVVKAFAQYTAVNNKTGNDDKIWQLGASVPVSAAGSVLVSYGQDKVSNKGGTDKIFSLGYDHFLSKRTDVYTALSNEKATGLKSGTTFAVGVKHAF
jgi:predicted porin